ncbi:MAG: DUF6338 family protein [Actinobacteria bacterium]|nr:DUF6338 family protein [Actinomycetota bacterium]
MLPTGIGVSLVLLSLVPGWLHLQLRKRLAPASSATGLSELLEVLAVGLATTGTSVALLIFVPTRWLSVLLDVDTWAAQGNDYLRQHVREAAASGLTAFILALAIAYLIYLPLRLRKPAEFRAQGSVWVHALGARPKGKVPWVALQLKDGKLIEGLLLSFSLSEEGLEQKDVALQRPIRVTLKQNEQPQWLELDRIIIPGNELSYITVTHVPERVGAG